MNEARSRRAARLFSEALARPGAEREAFLGEHCENDPALQQEIDDLLRAHEQMGEFLEGDAAAYIADLAPRPRKPFEPGTLVGAYRVVRVLGSGAAGTIYEALQASPHRQVALKVMGSGLQSPAAIERFEQEAEILARLDHPHIAHVYEAGVHEADGTSLPYFALEYVSGARDIVSYASANGLGTRARLELFAQTCDAVHHGHEKGVIHRDLKPANLLVAETGEVKVIDFGIARVEGLGRGPREIAGTLQYMSPEQCVPEGGDVDVRSDVYALGVVLYELLTGRVPYDVSTSPVHEAMRTIREQQAIRIDSVKPSLRGDIAAIVHKALSKDRSDRYASAAALADDLRRHLSAYPVEAVGGGALYHLSRFARRRRLAFLSLIAVVVVSVCAAVVSGWFAYEAERERQTSDRHAYIANVASASASLRVHDVAPARQRLERVPQHLRGWEWRHLHGRLDTSAETIAWSGHVLRTGAVSPDGSLLAMSGCIGPNCFVTVWNLADGTVRFTVGPERRGATSLAFDGAGMLLAMGYHDGKLELRSAATGDLVRRLDGHGSPGAPLHARHVNAVAFLPDGRRLASASGDRTIKLWEVATGSLLRTLEGHTDRVVAMALAPDGRLLVSGGREGHVKVWDVEIGATLRTLTGHADSVDAVAISPDGKLVCSGSRDQTMRLWRWETEELIAASATHRGNVRGVAFSPDGLVLATASWDRTLRLWNTADGSERDCLIGHTDRVEALSFVTADRLVSFSREGAAKTWRTSGSHDIPSLDGHTDTVYRLVFSPDGRHLVSVPGSYDRSVRVWDVRTRSAIRTLPGVRPVEARFLPRTGQLATFDLGERGGGTALSVRSFPDCAVRTTLLGISGDVVADAGRNRVLGAWGHTDLGVWDVESGVLVRHWTSGHDNVYTLELAPSAAQLACGSATGEISIWNVATQERQALTRVHERVIRSLSFSPDGSHLATPGSGHEVVVLDAQTLTRTATLVGHSAQVEVVAYSPDGLRLATGGLDGTVRLWDSATHEEVLVLEGHHHSVHALAYSPDGTLLVSGGGSTDAPGEIRIWEAPLATDTR